MPIVTVTFDLDKQDDLDSFKTYTKGVDMEVALFEIRQIFHELKHNEEIDRYSNDCQYIFNKINEITNDLQLDM